MGNPASGTATIGKVIVAAKGRTIKVAAAAIALIVFVGVAAMAGTANNTTTLSAIGGECREFSELKIAPVLGFDAPRVANAATIIRIGNELAVPTDQIISALMAGITESGLHNFVPTDFQPYTNRKQDHDSLGVFQMRPSMGWGTIAQVTDMDYQARKWFERMREIDGWQTMPLGDLAQKVEVSAYPDRYATHESTARALYKAITGIEASSAQYTPPGSPAPGTPTTGTYTGPVWLLGDSLGVGMEPHTPDGWTSDNIGGRSTEEGLRILNSGIPSHAQPTTVPWVISLATNQPSGLAGFQAAAQQIAQIAGPTRPIYWFNTYIGSNPQRQTETNRALKALAAEYPNIRILDWATLAASNPAWFGPDGIHPSGTGYSAKTEMAVDAVRAGAAGTGTLNANCEQTATSGKIDTMLTWAKTQVGAPYAAIGNFRFGTTPWDGNRYCHSDRGTCWEYPAGTIVYDCSGFVVTAYRQIGVDLAKHGATHTGGMRDNKWFIDVPPNEANVQPGDLILYAPVNGVGHVIISMGGSDSIESSGSKGVWISKVQWDRVIQIKRVPPDALNGGTDTPGNVTEDTAVN